MSDVPEMYALVELFGHTKLAGRIREVQMFGAPAMCVEVPAVGDRPGSVHYYGRAAVFGWHIIDEAEALAWAAHLAVPGVLPAFARQERITADAHIEYDADRFEDPWTSARDSTSDEDDDPYPPTVDGEPPF